MNDIDYVIKELEIFGLNPRKISKLDGGINSGAFKIETDPFVGRLCFFRVYSGSLDAGSYIFNNRK